MKRNRKSAGIIAIAISICLVLTTALLNNDNLYAAGVRAGISAADDTPQEFHTARVEVEGMASDGTQTEGTADGLTGVQADSADPLAGSDNAAAAEEQAASPIQYIDGYDGNAFVVDTSLVSPDDWTYKLMANVEVALNIRAEADPDAEVIGLLRRGDVAQILGAIDEWVAISSGDVIGYVNGDYCLYGEDAHALANELTTTYVTSLTGALKVRSEGSADASVITMLYEGQQVEYDADATAYDGWVAVKTDDGDGYVNAEYVNVSTTYSEAITMEEERALIQKELEEAEAKKAAEKAAEQAAKKSTSKSNSSSSSSSTSSGSSSSKSSSQSTAKSASGYDDETLLAAIIQYEAGSDTADGMLAVGAVIMNRVESASYPNTIYDVIYQSGQFPSASSGGLANILAKGVSSSARSAAQSALAGSDNTGGMLHFQPARTGHSGTVIGAHVFY